MKTQRQTTEAAQVAKLARTILKATYPNTKFSVTSETYSGGDSIRVSWNFGPTEKEVNTIISKFKGGHFNGMEDIYEYNETSFEVDKDGNVVAQPTVKYISTSRNYVKPETENRYDSAVLKQIEELVCKCFNVEYVNQNTLLVLNGGSDSHVSNFTGRMLYNISFPSDDIEILNATFKTNNTGYWTDCVQLEFNDLKSPVKGIEIKDRVANTPTIVAGDIQILNYSEKSFVVTGETKAIKDTLKDLQGRFNFNLKHPETGDKLIGWIFPLTKLDLVKSALNLI